MHIISKGRGALIVAAMLTGPVATGLAAQHKHEQESLVTDALTG